MPFASKVQQAMWKYTNRYRTDLTRPSCEHLFLTRDGRPMTKDRIDKMVACYGRRDGIQGVRCSPHILRHTSAGGFSAMVLMSSPCSDCWGFFSLEMTRRYCELADIDVKSAHLMASPVDNFVLRHRGTVPLYIQSSIHRGPSKDTSWSDRSLGDDLCLLPRITPGL